MMESLGVFALAIAAVVVLVYAWGCWQARQSSSLRYTRNTFLASLGLMVGVATAFAGGLGLAISGVLALLLMITMNSIVDITPARLCPKERSRMAIYMLVGFILGRSWDISFIPWIIMGIVFVERTIFYVSLRRAKRCA